MPRVFFAFLAALISAALVAVAAAQPGPPQGPGPRMAATPPQQGPQLTDDQLTKMQALATEQRERVRAARDQMRKLQEQMRAEVWADTPDEAKIRQLRGDLAKAQQEMFTARLDFQAKRAQVLTPEQRKQVRGMQARRQVWGRRGFGPWPGLGPAMRGFRGGMRRFGRPWGGPGPMPPGAGYGPGWRWWNDEP